MSMKKIQWHHRESNPRPSGLYRSDSTNCVTACPRSFIVLDVNGQTISRPGHLALGKDPRCLWIESWVSPSAGLQVFRWEEISFPCRDSECMLHCLFQYQAEQDTSGISVTCFVEQSIYDQMFTNNISCASMFWHELQSKKKEHFYLTALTNTAHCAYFVLLSYYTLNCQDFQYS
jgi:hypothetical protein